jgi:hypothetical protein
VAATAAATLEQQRLQGPSSPAPSLSSEEWKFEFIIVLSEDSLGIQRLSDKFDEFVTGNEPAALQQREACYGFCRWPVDVLFDGRGCVLTIRYEGNDEMRVKVFDDTSCRWHYHTDNKEDGD